MTTQNTKRKALIMFGLLSILFGCNQPPAAKENEYILSPDAPLSNKEITELIMIQHPRIKKITYDRLSDDLKKQFKQVEK